MDVDHYREKHARKERRRARQRLKPRCSVWVCGRTGPHLCNEVAVVRDDGRAICSSHLVTASHRAVYTPDEAIALYHAEQRRWRLEIDRPS